MFYSSIITCKTRTELAELARHLFRNSQISEYLEYIRETHIFEMPAINDII